MFVGDFNRKEAKSYVQNLTDEYKEAIQEITYNKVMDKIKKEKSKIFFQSFQQKSFRK